MGHDIEQLPEEPTALRRQWAAYRALCPPMRSPGRPEPSRAVQREFWRLIATGIRCPMRQLAWACRYRLVCVGSAMLVGCHY